MPIDLGLYAEDESVEGTVVVRGGKLRQKSSEGSQADKGKRQPDSLLPAIRAVASENWDDDFIFNSSNTASPSTSAPRPPPVNLPTLAPSRLGQDRDKSPSLGHKLAAWDTSRLKPRPSWASEASDMSGFESDDRAIPDRSKKSSLQRESSNEDDQNWDGEDGDQPLWDLDGTPKRKQVTSGTIKLKRKDIRDPSLPSASRSPISQNKPTPKTLARSSSNSISQSSLDQPPGSSRSATSSGKRRAGKTSPTPMQSSFSSSTSTMPPLTPKQRIPHSASRAESDELASPLSSASLLSSPHTQSSSLHRHRSSQDSVPSITDISSYGSPEGIGTSSRRHPFKASSSFGSRMVKGWSTEGDGDVESDFKTDGSVSLGDAEELDLNQVEKLGLALDNYDQWGPQPNLMRTPHSSKDSQLTFTSNSHAVTPGSPSSRSPSSSRRARENSLSTYATSPPGSFSSWTNSEMGSRSSSGQRDPQLGKNIRVLPDRPDTALSWTSEASFPEAPFDHRVSARPLAGPSMSAGTATDREANWTTEGEGDSSVIRDTTAVFEPSDESGGDIYTSAGATSSSQGDASQQEQQYRSRKTALYSRPVFAAQSSQDSTPPDPPFQEDTTPAASSSIATAPGVEVANVSRSGRSSFSRASDDSQQLGRTRRRKLVRKKRPSSGTGGSDGSVVITAEQSIACEASVAHSSQSRTSGDLAFAEDSGDDGMIQRRRGGSDDPEPASTRTSKRSDSPFELITEADLNATPPPVAFPATRTSSDSKLMKASAWATTRQSLSRRSSSRKGSDSDIPTSRPRGDLASGGRKARRPLSFTSILGLSNSARAAAAAAAIVASDAAKSTAPSVEAVKSTDPSRRSGSLHLPQERSDVGSTSASGPSVVILERERRGHQRGALSTGSMENFLNPDRSIMSRIRRISRHQPMVRSDLKNQHNLNVGDDATEELGTSAHGSRVALDEGTIRPSASGSRHVSVDQTRKGGPTLLQRRVSTRSTKATLGAIMNQGSPPSASKSRPPRSNPALRRLAQSISVSLGFEPNSSSAPPSLPSSSTFLPISNSSNVTTSQSSPSSPYTNHHPSLVKTDLPRSKPLPFPVVRTQRSSSCLERHEENSKLTESTSSATMIRSNSLGELKIPSRITSAQTKLSEDLARVKEFARGISELKELRKTYRGLIHDKESVDQEAHELLLITNLEMKDSSGVSPQAFRRLGGVSQRIEVEYRQWWDYCTMLIELGDGSERDEVDHSPSRGRNVSMNPTSSTSDLGRSKLLSSSQPTLIPTSTEKSETAQTVAQVTSPMSPSDLQKYSILKGAIQPSFSDTNTFVTSPQFQPIRSISSTSDHSTESTGPMTTLHTGKTSSSSATVSLSASSHSSLSLGDFAGTPPRTGRLVGRVLSGGLSAKRSASQLFRGSKGSKMSSSTSDGLSESSRSTRPTSPPPPVPSKLPPSAQVTPRARRKVEQPPRRKGINGIKDFLRVLKARVKAEERRAAGLAPPIVDGDDLKRCVSDNTAPISSLTTPFQISPLPTSLTSKVRPDLGVRRRPQQDAIQNTSSSSLPQPSSNSSSSSSEENWDEMFGFNKPDDDEEDVTRESIPSPLGLTHSPDRLNQSRRERPQSSTTTTSHSTTSPAALSSLTSSGQGIWPSGTKLTLTTEAMPQLLDYLTNVKQHCSKCISEMKAQTV